MDRWIGKLISTLLPLVTLLQADWPTNLANDARTALIRFDQEAVKRQRNPHQNRMAKIKRFN